jgi:hypothetical protein
VLIRAALTNRSSRSPLQSDSALRDGASVTRTPLNSDAGQYAFSISDYIMNSIDYLENEIRPRVQNEIVGLAEAYSAGTIPGGGHYSIPREVFCLVDHLGQLSNDTSGSTIRAITFIKAYFPIEYHTYAELLIAMWRHGTVHSYGPNSVRATISGSSVPVEIQWLSANHDLPRERGAHLLVYPVEGQQYTAKLVVNTVQLAHDFLAAINHLVDAVRRDASLKRECDRRLTALNAVKDCTSFAGKTHQDAIRAEVRAAWRSRDGLISLAGTIRKRHANEKSPAIAAQHAQPDAQNECAPVSSMLPHDQSLNH